MATLQRMDVLGPGPCRGHGLFKGGVDGPKHVIRLALPFGHLRRRRRRRWFLALVQVQDSPALQVLGQ